MELGGVTLHGHCTDSILTLLSLASCTDNAHSDSLQIKFFVT